MLNKVRTVAQTMVFKIILVVIVLVFVIGLANNTIFQQNNNRDRVKFTKAKNISEIELEREKRMLSLQMQQNSVTDADLEQAALNSLLNQHLFNQLADDYDILVSDQEILDDIHSSKLFVNDEQQFDLNLFENFLRRLNINERQYFTKSKNYLAVNMITNSFINNCYIPSMVVNDIIDLVTQARIIQLVSIDLLDKKFQRSLPNPTKEQLNKFYKDHQDMFTEPEKRHIKYVILDSQYFTDQVKPNKEDLEDFYNTHHDQLKEIEDFDKDIEKVKEQYISKHISRAIKDTISALEDDVASGSSLNEIANNINAKIDILNNVAKDDLLNHPILSNFADNVFDLHEHETSYPLEIEEEKLILIYIDKVINPQINDFNDVYDLVLTAWQKNNCKEYNLKLLSDFKKNATTETFISEAINIGFTLEQDIKINRSYNNDVIPNDLITKVFSLKEKEISDVYVSTDDDKAYVVLLSSIVNDPELEKKISVQIINNLHNALRDLTLHELFMYLYQYNHPSIKSIKG